MPHIARVTVSGLDFGQVTQNALHFTYLPEFWNPQAIAAEIVAGWFPQITRFSKSNFSYKNILVQSMSDPTLSTFSLPINIAGLQVNDTRLPSYVSSVIRIITAVGGKHGRGRIYVAGVSADALQNGVHNSLFQTQSEGFLNTLKGRYAVGGTSDLRLGVYNRTANSIIDMIDLKLRPVPGTQRNRNIGIGV